MKRDVKNIPATSRDFSALTKLNGWKLNEMEMAFSLCVGTGVLCSEPAPALGPGDAEMNITLCFQRAWLRRIIGSPQMNPSRARRKPMVCGGHPRTLLGSRVFLLDSSSALNYMKIES